MQCALLESAQMKPASAASRFSPERLLRIDPESKPRVYMQIFEAADLSNLNYWLELLFSAGIATLGLVLNSPAVVIGAMLISPLMGPIIAAGLALAAADLYLGVKSLLNLVASIGAAVVISAFLVWLIPLHSPTTEILSRTRPNVLDLGVALLSGLAGSLLVFRGAQNGGSSALPGVAIAVALMPPLCAAGFGIGSGFNWPIIAGASLLFITNLAAIIASAFFVFLAVRMHSRDVRADIDGLLLERASHGKLYGLIRQSAIARPFGDIGKLHWRVLMLVTVLAILYVPLRKALVQVRNEAVARAAVNEALRRITGPDNIVSQQITFSGEAGPVRVNLIVTGPVDSAKVADAQRIIERRTGRRAQLAVRQVADQAELARLRAGLEAPPPAAPPPPPQTLTAMQGEIVARLEAAIKDVWPPDLKLQQYESASRPMPSWCGSPSRRAARWRPRPPAFSRAASKAAWEFPPCT